MTLIELYNSVGEDLNDVIDRIEDVEVIKYAVLGFLDDGSYSAFMQEIQNKNISMAFQAIHALKGVCLCLGFNKLSKYTMVACENLREGRLPSNEILSCLDGEYNRILAAVRLFYQNQ